MQTYDLKYGSGNLKVTPSDTLIGVRPRRTVEAQSAVRQVLDGDDFTERGTLGGFRIIAVTDQAIDVDATLDEIRASADIETGTHVFEIADGNGVLVPTGELFVTFAPDASEDHRQALLDQHALAIKDARGPDSFILAVTPASSNPIKVAAALQTDPGVVIAEPDLASRATVKAPLAADSLLPEQWHLQNLGFHRSTSQGFLKGADSRVIDAWKLARTRGRAEVVVAVIDDGFDLAHPDLATPGKVVHPWDFTRRNNTPVPDHGDWHGTACAGVAAAAVGGGGVLGAAPGCTLMPVRWGPDLSDAQVETWFNYVAARGAWVVSCSWGAVNRYFPLSTRKSQAIARCAREGRGGKGCVIVFAAGNEDRDVNNPGAGTVAGFAAHPDVIAVAACNSRDQRSRYSNHGREISVCAPSSGPGGWGVLTSDVAGADANGMPFGYSEGDYTYDFGGTSSACPLVAGIAALALSINPGLSALELKQLLQRTARRIGSPADYDANGHSRHYGYGCVNALEVVRALLAEPADTH